MFEAIGRARPYLYPCSAWVLLFIGRHESLYSHMAISPAKKTPLENCSLVLIVVLCDTIELISTHCFGV